MFSNFSYLHQLFQFGWQRVITYFNWGGGAGGGLKHLVCDPSFPLIALINLYTFDTKSLKVILS